MERAGGDGQREERLGKTAVFALSMPLLSG